MPITINEVLIDQDGVLSSFVSAYLKLVGSPLQESDIHGWHMENYTNQTEEEMWQCIREAGESFWTDMEAYPWAYDLLTNFPTFYVCTAASTKSPAAWTGKIRWLNTFCSLWGIPTPKVIMTADKHLLAAPDRLLIDDKPSSVKQFIKAGGNAILFPRPWNTSGDSSDPMATLWKKTAPDLMLFCDPR